MEGQLEQAAALFVLVLSRVGGVVATAPLLSAQTAPLRFRAFLAVALALVVTPLVVHEGLPGVDAGGPLGIAEYGRMVASEVLVGLLLGLGVAILLAGVQVAGQMVSQMSGMALGDVFNPDLDSSVSVFTQLFHYVTLAVFAAIGGHRMIVEALLKTFRWAPPGRAHLGESYSDAVVTMLSQSFELGIRASAPIVIALFLSTVVLGLVSRTLPQINTVVVGFGINSLLTLGTCMLCLGAVAWAFQQPLANALDELAVAATQQAAPSVSPDFANPTAKT